MEIIPIFNDNAHRIRIISNILEVSIIYLVIAIALKHKLHVNIEYVLIRYALLFCLNALSLHHRTENVHHFIFRKKSQCVESGIGDLIVLINNHYDLICLGWPCSANDIVLLLKHWRNKLPVRTRKKLRPDICSGHSV